MTTKITTTTEICPDCQELIDRQRFDLLPEVRPLAAGEPWYTPRIKAHGCEWCGNGGPTRWEQRTSRYLCRGCVAHRRPFNARRDGASADRW